MIRSNRIIRYIRFIIRQFIAVEDGSMAQIKAR